jgi:RNase P subunit RPR2
MHFKNFNALFQWALSEGYRQVENSLTTQEDRRQIGFIAGHQCHDCNVMIHPDVVSTYRQINTGATIYVRTCRKCGTMETYNRR